MSAASPTRALQSSCAASLLSLRPATRRQRDGEVDNRAASVIKKERAAENKRVKLAFKEQCSKHDAVKAQDALVLELSSAIAKFTGLWEKYPQKGLGVKVDLREYGVQIFTSDDLPIMRNELARIVGNYEFIFKAHSTRAPRDENPRDFRGPQYSRVLLTPEGIDWVNREDFSGYKNELVQNLGYPTFNDTLLSRGAMLRGTLNTLIHLALVDYKVDQGTPPKRKKTDTTPRVRRLGRYTYTPAMKEAFGGNTKSFYNFRVIPDLPAGKFEIEKVPNAGNENVLQVLKRRYDAKISKLAGTTKTQLTPFSTEQLIGPYAQSITGWIAYDDADLDAQIDAASNDVKNAFSNDESVPEVAQAHKDLIDEYNAVRTLKTALSDEADAEKKAKRSAKKTQRKIIRVGGGRA